MANSAKLGTIAAIAVIGSACSRPAAVVAMTEVNDASVSPPADSGKADAGTSDGAASKPPGPGSGCPEDANWNGSVCLGGGYITCPGAMHLVDGGCTARGIAAVPAAPRLAPGKDASVNGTDESEDDEEPVRLRKR